MAQLVLKIVGDAKHVEGVIAGLKKEIAGISKEPIKLNIDSKTIGNTTKALNDAAAAGNKLKQSISTTWSGDNTSIKKAETQLLGLGKTMQNVTKIVNGEVQSQTKTITTNYDQITKATQKQQAAAEAAARKQAENTRIGMALYDEMAASVQRVNTPLQDQIDKLTGVSAAMSYSAKESAAFFQQQAAAENKLISLKTAYANLAVSIDNMKSKYPRGTFDALTAEVDRQRAALQDLTGKESDFAERVREADVNLKEQKSTFAELKAGGDKFADGISRLVSQFISLQIVMTKVRQAFREAFDEMKKVDTELTNIQKVSGMSADELDKIAEKAYSTASKYGVAADEYLSAVYTFQKAGLGDSATLLGELATKTMLVGDTTADIAEQFIVSSNAAWQLHGSYEALSKIVDEADYVNNNYATTLEKIAQGLPRVASVAANAGMTAEETIAAIGTITSITQETGSRAGTALRALIMNISGEVGELEDGIVVTEETIKSLGGILEKYAGDALAAAQSTGKMLNPMIALQALADAAKNDLSEIETFSLMSGFGGKLRTNQLMALVNNMEMVNAMLDGMAESAGTADAEIGVMLSSWEAKTEQLKNTWTEFVNHMVETDQIKGAVDTLKTWIEGLDTTAGRLIATLMGVSVAIVAISTALQKVKIQHPALLAVAAALGVIIGLIGKFHKSLEDQKTIVDDLRIEYAKNEDEYNRLVSKAGELTDAEAKRLLYLQQQKNELEAQEKLYDKKYYNEWQREYGFNKVVASETGKSGNVYNDTFRDQIDLAEMQARLALQRSYFASGDYESAATTNQELYNDYVKIVQALHDFQEADMKLSVYQEQLIALFEEEFGYIGDITEATEELTEANENVADAFDEAGDAAENAEQKVIDFWETLKKSTEHGDALKDWAAKYEKALEAFEEGGYGSKIIEDVISHVFGEDVWAKVEGDGEAIGELLNGAIMKGLYGAGGEDYGYGFFQEIFDAGTKIATEDGRTISVLFNDAGEAVAAVEQQADGSLGAVQGNIEDIAEAIGVSIEATAEATEAAEYYGGAIEDIPNTAVTDVIFNAGLAIQEVDKLLRKIGQIPRNLQINANINGLASGTDYAEGGPTLVNEEGPELIAQDGEAFIAGGGYPVITDLERGATVIPADETQRILRNGVELPIQSLAGGAVGGSHGFKISFTNRVAGTAVSTGGGGGGSSSSSSKSSKSTDKSPMEEMADKVADELSNLDKQAKLAQNQGDYAKVVSIYGKAQSVINNLIDAYRKAGYSETSDEILDLKNKLFDYADKVEDVHDDLRKELEKTAKAAYDVYDKVIDAQTGAIDDQISAMKKEREEANEINELEEKRLAVMEAQEALRNTQAQRNVRIYNAATGQYEWIANRANVQSAQEALKKAEDNLNKYLDDLSFDKQVEALNQLKEAINTEGKTRKDELDNLLSVFEDPVRDIASVLNDLYGSGDRNSYAAIAQYVSSVGAASNISGIGGGLSDFAAAIGAMYGSGYGVGGAGATSNLKGSDSHDTIYTFPGGITLTQQQAQVTTIADMARQLRVLGIAN